MNLTRRRLSEYDEPFEVPEMSRRKLLPSKYISKNNEGTLGAGIVYAIDDSNVFLRGSNFQDNKGYEGGVVYVRESKLYTLEFLATGNIAESNGGFI